MFTALSRIVAPRMFAGLPMLLIGLWMLGPGGQTANGQITCANSVNFAGGVVTITGTDGDDVIILTVEEVDEGGFTEGDAAAVPPVPGDPPVAAFYLLINGQHCGLQPPATPAGIAIGSVTKIVINSLGGTDLINLSGLADDFEAEPPEVKSRPTEVNAGEGDDTVIGGDGADIIHGNNGRDTLVGNKGSDQLFGDDGNDTMYGGNGGDLMDGGVGFDTIDASTAGEAEDVATGTLGIGADLDINILEDVPVVVAGITIRTIDVLANDTFEQVLGTSRDDRIIGDPLLPTLMYGGDGNDYIRGGAANDLLWGEEGSDELIAGDGVDDIRGGEDDDSLDAGGGDDVIVIGEAGNDIIIGGDGNDVLIGGDDDDRVSGDAGDDVVTGDDGDDNVSGGDGDDVVTGDDGDDNVSGGDGIDTVRGGLGDDRVSGGAGDDIVSGDDGDDVVTAEDGDDVASGGVGDDSVDGGPGNDQVTGGEGDDRVYGDTGDDIVDGGDGDDLVSGGDGIDAVYGGAGDDSMFGGDGNDHMFGGPGDDGAGDEKDFSAGPGDDVLEGEAGDDEMSGGSGDDVLRGGPGDDVLVGDGGYDVADYSQSPFGVVADFETGVTAADGYAPAGTDAMGACEVLRGGVGGDSLSGMILGGDTILGGPGQDTIVGRGADDVLYGEDGNDGIEGGDDPDILMGGNGNDSIDGGTRGGIDRLPWADEIYGDGDLVPHVDPALDLDFADDQFIRLTEHPMDPTVSIIVEVINIRAALRDYAGAGTVGDNFALPCKDTTAGADTIWGNSGGDWIAGGAGGDEIFGDWPLRSQDGSDLAGADLIFGDRVVNRPFALTRGGDWGPWSPIVEDVDGSKGGEGGDTIRAGSGGDTVIGCGGSDTINGNRGDDRIFGDYVFANDADYILIRDNNVAAGADFIRGCEDVDILFGGPGGDTLVGGDPASSDGWEGDGVAGGTEEDGSFALMGVLSGGTIRRGDVIQGNGGADTIIGGECRLPNRNSFPADARDQLDRGTASGAAHVDTWPADTIDYHMVQAVADGGSGASIDLGFNVPGGSPIPGSAANDGEPVGVLPVEDTIYAIENVVGTRNDDVITGTTRSDDTLLTGRDSNTSVVDAFFNSRFPNDPGDPLDPTDDSIRIRSRTGYDNILLGLAGNDLIIGRMGEDALGGGPGDDVLWGDGMVEGGGVPPEVINPDDPSTSGNDELWGDPGNDRVYGEWGRDIAHGGLGNDFYSGGHGEDILDYAYFPGGVVMNLRQASVDLQLWTNLITVSGVPLPYDPTAAPPLGFGPLPVGNLVIPNDATADPTDTLTVNFPGGTVQPGFNYDPVAMLADPANAAITNRGMGTVSKDATTFDVVVNREPHLVATPPNGLVYNYDRFETILASVGNDVIYGHDTDPCHLFGLTGNDILVGGAAADILEGDFGSDVLEGQAGNDTLVGGPEPPTPPGVQHQSEFDWISYNEVVNGTATGVVVNLAETGPQDTKAAGMDRQTDVECALGSQYADVLKGNHRQNRLYGMAGGDILSGRADEDILQNNRLTITSDDLDGGAGNDLADYRVSNPTQVADSLALMGACLAGAPVPPAAPCFMQWDGEGGSDRLWRVETALSPDSGLLVNVPTEKVISPGTSITLDFFALGGNGFYKAAFDPTTDMKVQLDEEGEPSGLPDLKVPILTLPGQTTAVRDILDLSPNEHFAVVATPLKTTTFRVTVTDMQNPDEALRNDPPAQKVATGYVNVIVTDELEVAIDQETYVISSGNTARLNAVVTGGRPPYTVSWVADDGSQATTLSATNILVPIANPTTTTKYTVTVQDTAPDSIDQVATAEVTVEVLAGFAAPNPSGQTNPGGTTANAGGQTSTGGNADQNTAGTNNQTPTAQGADSTEAEQTSAPAPFCGGGVGAGFMAANLLLMAVMKRRRW